MMTRPICPDKGSFYIFGCFSFCSTLLIPSTAIITITITVMIIVVVVVIIHANEWPTLLLVLAVAVENGRPAWIAMEGMLLLAAREKKRGISI
jgi:hypothetical protein